jgi:hypothetical protein
VSTNDINCRTIGFCERASACIESTINMVLIVSVIPSDLTYATAQSAAACWCRVPSLKQSDPRDLISARTVAQSANMLCEKSGLRPFGTLQVRSLDQQAADYIE